MIEDFFGPDGYFRYDRYNSYILLILYFEWIRFSENNSVDHFEYWISREDSFHKLLKGLRGRNEEDTQRNKRDVAKTANELISGFKVLTIWLRHLHYIF